MELDPLCSSEDESRTSQIVLESNHHEIMNFNGRMIRKIETPGNLARDIVLRVTLPLRVLYVFVTEIFLSIICGLMAVFAYLNLDPTTPDPSRTPVLFLHGANHNQSGSLSGKALLRCFSAIRGEPLGSFYSISYAGIVTNGKKETFETYADKAFEKIRQIYKETGKFPTLVGHSMGGIVSTCLAKKCEEAKDRGSYQLEDGTLIPLSPQEQNTLGISSIITLGAPFDGSYIGDAFCKLTRKFGAEPITVYQDMRTNSQKSDGSDRLSKLKNFALEANKTGKISYYNIGSTIDEFVPKGYFVTANPDRQYEVHHIGHLGLLSSPPVWSKIHKWLVGCN